MIDDTTLKLIDEFVKDLRHIWLAHLPEILTAKEPLTFKVELNGKSIQAEGSYLPREKRYMLDIEVYPETGGGKERLHRAWVSESSKVVQPGLDELKSTIIAAATKSALVKHLMMPDDSLSFGLMSRLNAEILVTIHRTGKHNNDVEVTLSERPRLLPAFRSPRVLEKFFA